MRELVGVVVLARAPARARSVASAASIGIEHASALTPAASASSGRVKVRPIAAAVTSISHRVRRQPRQAAAHEVGHPGRQRRAHAGSSSPRRADVGEDLLLRHRAQQLHRRRKALPSVWRSTKSSRSSPRSERCSAPWSHSRTSAAVRRSRRSSRTRSSRESRWRRSRTAPVRRLLAADREAMQMRSDVSCASTYSSASQLADVAPSACPPARSSSGRASLAPRRYDDQLLEQLVPLERIELGRLDVGAACPAAERGHEAPEQRPRARRRDPELVDARQRLRPRAEGRAALALHRAARHHHGAAQARPRAAAGARASTCRRPPRR